MSIVKEKRFHYYKDWFVFPFAVMLEKNLMWYNPPASSLTLHFLWWHWQWTIVKGK